ncbi:MAG: hypothetical protein IT426_02310 [Pirellulales bacterium]|nr:hypothetical protein [Pirellulales bacterium]
MSESAREQLLGFMLGALESDERAEIEAQLESDPECRKELTLLRRQLEPLAALKQDFGPPVGLAARTCRYVAEHRAAPTPAKGRLRPEPVPPSWIGRMSWLDMAMAATVLVAAGLLIFPAVQNSRFHAHLAACQDNLRELGGALNLYSQSHHGYFPSVPSRGKLAAAGIYAPVLAQNGLLTEVNRVVCPESSLAARRNDFRVPTYGELELTSPAKMVDLRPTLGGSYGYNLGYTRNGEYQPTKNLYRDDFAIMSDAPNMSGANLQSANHGGRGQNVLFEGGGVQFLTATQPLGSKDDIFTNDNGQVAAGVNANDSVLGASGTAPIRFVNSQK